MTAPEKPLYHTTRSGSTFYNGCARSDCGGERIRGFNDCIVHLSPDEAEQYAVRLRAGQDELVISSVNVDMNFVKMWMIASANRSMGIRLFQCPKNAGYCTGW